MHTDTYSRPVSPARTLGLVLNGNVMLTVRRLPSPRRGSSTHAVGRGPRGSQRLPSSRAAGQKRRLLPCTPRTGPPPNSTALGDEVCTQGPGGTPPTTACTAHFSTPGTGSASSPRAALTGRVRISRYSLKQITNLPLGNYIRKTHGIRPHLWFTSHGLCTHTAIVPCSPPLRGPRLVKQVTHVL